MLTSRQTSRGISRVTSRVTSRKWAYTDIVRGGNYGRGYDGRLTGGVGATPPAPKPFVARYLRAKREVGRLNLQKTASVIRKMFADVGTRRTA